MFVLLPTKKELGTVVYVLNYALVYPLSIQNTFGVPIHMFHLRKITENINRKSLTIKVMSGRRRNCIFPIRSLFQVTLIQVT